MRSVMEHSFSNVPGVEIPRSTFNRSFGKKTTFDADYLVPFLVDEVLPGDTFNVNTTMMARLATAINPIMDNIYIETFYFFVPNRLVYDDWHKLLGAQDDPGDSTDYTTPKLSGGNVDLTDDSLEAELALYMELPYTANLAGDTISGLPFRAYNLIWREWFRDQNLQDSPEVLTGISAGAGLSLYPLLKRGKRHDYFTSALPWPQKGDAVDLPLGTTAPITGLGVGAGNMATAGPVSIKEAGDETSYGDYFTTNTDNFFINSSTATDDVKVFADLANATSATINDLRLSFQLQRLLERDARSGTRINEVIKAHFGVDVPDQRVQRPEFLGGGSSRVNITPVANTTSIGTQGELAAFGIASDSHGFTKSFTEHGFILGLLSARADITYQQGVDRMWFRDTRYDYYWPVLSQIGEQAITNNEIFYSGDSAPGNLTFGYQERNAEYRYKQSRITGKFLSARSDTLDPWHLSEEFSVLPTLGDTFIQSNTPLDRCIAVPTQPHFIADIYCAMKCARPMPLFGVPGNLDHF